MPVDCREDDYAQEWWWWYKPRYADPTDCTPCGCSNDPGARPANDCVPVSGLYWADYRLTRIPGPSGTCVWQCYQYLKTDVDAQPTCCGDPRFYPCVADGFSWECAPDPYTDPVPECAHERNCEWDYITCKWCCSEYLVDGAECPSGTTWNASARACIIDGFTEPTCPTGYTWDWLAFDCVLDGDDTQSYCDNAWVSPSDHEYYDGTSCVHISDVLYSIPVYDPYDCGGEQLALPCENLTGTYFFDYVMPDGRLASCVENDGIKCTKVIVFDPDSCSCIEEWTECAPGECLCNDPYGSTCIPCTLPDCGVELNCEWDPDACDWVCDDPCPTSGVWDYDLCRCIDQNAKDVDATFDQNELRYVEFRHAGDDTTALHVVTYVLNSATVPVGWTEDNSVEVISNGDSPCIIRLRTGHVRLAYVDSSTGTAKTSLWDLAQGERYVQVVANDSLEICQVEDKWGRLVCPVYVTSDDWYVVVGTLNSGGTGYDFSTPVKMVDKDNNPMDGVNAQASIKLLADGGYIFSYINSAGNSVRRRCRSLTNAGVGSWD